MPYTIASQCSSCDSENTFSIVLWPDYEGVCLCCVCKKLVNIPIETGLCPGCHTAPAATDYLDYASSIPYFGGMTVGQINAGPTCPRCGEAELTFQNRAHFNVVILGRTKDGSRPWWGKDTLEKAIFTISLYAFATQNELDFKELLRYYTLDIPRSLMSGRRPSFPIYRDIEAHISTRVMMGDAGITVSPKFKAMLVEQRRM